MCSRPEEPPRQPLPLQGRRQPPQELLEAPGPHCPSGLCQRLATLEARAPLGPQPEQGEPEPSQGPRDQAGQVRTAQHRATLRLDTLLPPAGPLAAEARALRLSYLRSGGHDPVILDQLLHLQLEATVLEKGTAGLRGGRQMGERQQQARACPPTGTVAPQPAPEAPPAVPAEPPSPGTHGLDAALLAVELENRRLEDELLVLKVRRERRADAGAPQASTGAWQAHRPCAPWPPPHPLCGPGGPSSCSGALSTRQGCPKVNQE
ncbi:PREDICTED: coiled-coil domain-containing protein 17 [Ficedula albicollis]|uniref:coiled-coil domain-containing protein 17 n=1 Tax=Ficedula albicollis TaxID=59894 RepID=UPI0007AD7C2D|nr:PREDICTED: coiled-coil domain-containing protein 17 [Ficedula albicollis]